MLNLRFVCSNILAATVYVGNTCISKSTYDILWRSWYLWANNTNLTLLLSIEVSVPRQETERSCIYALPVSSLPFSKILLLDFRNVARVLYVLFFIC
jgi:hypothetical protein